MHVLVTSFVRVRSLDLMSELQADDADDVDVSAIGYGLPFVFGSRGGWWSASDGSSRTTTSQPSGHDR